MFIRGYFARKNRYKLILVNISNGSHEKSSFSVLDIVELEVAQRRVPLGLELVYFPLQIGRGVIVETILPIDVAIGVETQRTTTLHRAAFALEAGPKARLSVHALIVVGELLALVEVARRHKRVKVVIGDDHGRIARVIEDHAVLVRAQLAPVARPVELIVVERVRVAHQEVALFGRRRSEQLDGLLARQAMMLVLVYVPIVAYVQIASIDTLAFFNGFGCEYAYMVLAILGRQFFLHFFEIFHFV